jgi:hypothetical protein
MGQYFTGALREIRDFVLPADFVYWGLQEVCMRRLWNWAAPSIEAPLGNQEGVHFTGDFEETYEGVFWKWSISLQRSSSGGTWRDSSFTGGP